LESTSGSFLASAQVAKGVSGGDISLRALAIAMPYPNTEGKTSLNVVLEVDGRSLLDRGDGTTLALEIYGYALGSDGGVEDFVSIAPTLDLAKLGSKLKESGLHFCTAFAVPAGSHELRSLVRDKEKGRRGLESIEATVPALDVPGLFLAAPVHG